MVKATATLRQQCEDLKELQEQAEALETENEARQKVEEPTARKEALQAHGVKM